MGGERDSDGWAPLPVTASGAERAARYAEVLAGLRAVLQGETDWVAAMATTACLLHGAFEYFHWTGFYQAGAPGARTLVIGPYQGHLGCLRIPFDRGVCGAAARKRATQLVPDVSAFPGYIACASSTQSEIVVPVLEGTSASGGSGEAAGGEAAARTGAGGGGEAAGGRLLAVLDVDSDHPAAFTQVDQVHLEELCSWLGRQGYLT